jgi:starch-binding outer membrane protein, SusD/RagB family
MRKTLQALALAAGTLAAAGCGDKFITETPVDFVAPENFYQSQTDALASVNAAYATFINQPLGSASYVGRNMFMLVEYPTDVLTSRLSATNERSLIGNFNPQFSSSHPYIETTFQTAYAGINRANTTIARVPAVPMDAARKAQIIGEAKFLRALHYYWLAGLFGGVPLKLTETAGITETPPPRATAAETWAQIEKDLTEAAAALPVSWPSTDFGRATKGAALTLLGKAYLQAAATLPTQAGDYAKAADAFRQVQTLGIYSLDNSYGSLFDGSNERSSEIIWSIQNIRVAGAGGYMSQWDAPVTSPAIFQPGAQNQYQAERPFYDSYDTTDVRKSGTWLTSFVNAGKTIPWKWNDAATVTAANYGSTGPVPRKFLDLGATAAGAEAPDFVVLRYADVLLGLAEAINGGGAPTAEAYTAVNAVRKRAHPNNAVAPAGATAAQIAAVNAFNAQALAKQTLVAGLAPTAFRDSVFAERRFEFAVEMQGVFDNRRNWEWSKARIEANMANRLTLNKSPNTSATEKATNPVSDKWKLYPIPLHACELNKTLTQNPGWEEGVCKAPVS